MHFFNSSIFVCKIRVYSRAIMTIGSTQYDCFQLIFRITETFQSRQIRSSRQDNRPPRIRIILLANLQMARSNGTCIELRRLERDPLLHHRKLSHPSLLIRIRKKTVRLKIRASFFFFFAWRNVLSDVTCRSLSTPTSIPKTGMELRIQGGPERMQQLW